jgi:hypothetical protein
MYKQIVEFHGFGSIAAGTFVFKELTILNSNYGYTVYYFKPPYSICSLNEKDLRSAYWLTNYYHCLPWYGGSIEYSLSLICGLITRIRENDSSKRLHLYTKGYEKKRYLESLLFAHKNVIVHDLTDIACITPVKVICPVHQTNELAKCSLQTAMHYCEWLYKQQSKNFTSLNV